MKPLKMKPTELWDTIFLLLALISVTFFSTLLISYTEIVKSEAPNLDNLNKNAHETYGIWSSSFISGRINRSMNQINDLFNTTKKCTDSKCLEDELNNLYPLVKKNQVNFNKELDKYIQECEAYNLSESCETWAYSRLTIEKFVDLSGTIALADLIEFTSEQDSKTISMTISRVLAAAFSMANSGIIFTAIAGYSGEYQEKCMNQASYENLTKKEKVPICNTKLFEKLENISERLSSNVTFSKEMIFDDCEQYEPVRIIENNRLKIKEKFDKTQTPALKIIRGIWIKNFEKCRDEVLNAIPKSEACLSSKSYLLATNSIAQIMGTAGTEATCLTNATTNNIIEAFQE